MKWKAGEITLLPKPRFSRTQWIENEGAKPEAVTFVKLTTQNPLNHKMAPCPNVSAHRPRITMTLRRSEAATRNQQLPDRFTLPGVSRPLGR